MKIVIISKKGVIDDIKGRLPTNALVDLPDHKALFYISRGEAMRFETKVQQERPSQAVGAEELLSVSPAAQVSAQTTSSESATGAKRRGRPRKLSS